jgi:hypothetical protein
MDAFWSAVVVAGLGLWLLLTMLYQFRRRPWRWLRRWDPFRLLPRWTFFAPHPGGTDLHLQYRDVDPATLKAEAGEWTEISLRVPRGLRAAVWHPGRRGRKVLLDAVRALFALAEEVEPAALQITTPYLLLLQVVTAPGVGAAEPAPGRYRQFRITESFGFLAERPPRVLFESQLHAL